MALDPLELATIAAVIVVFFLYGPQKIPELARMVAQARREFDKASKEFQSVAVGIQDGTSSLLAQPKGGKPSPPLPPPVQREEQSALPQPSGPAPQASAKTGDQLLIEAARRLGIQTQGKTREEIQQEIIARAQPPPPAGDAPQQPSKADQAS
jgi:sec-independent protein translocase protein TatA